MKCPTCASQIYWDKPHSCGIAAKQEERMRYEGQCERCGGSVYVAGERSLHSCPTVVVFKTPAKTKERNSMKVSQEREEPEVTPQRAKRVYLHFNITLASHEKTCGGCRFYVERGSKVRCHEYLGIEWMQQRWQKRAGIGR
jgi:hypothetical protein